MCCYHVFALRYECHARSAFAHPCGYHLSPLVNRVGEKIMTFCHQLEKYRKKYKMTYEELAHKSNLTKSYLNRLSREDKDNPSLKSLKKLAKAFNVPVSVLIDEDDDLFTYNAGFEDGKVYALSQIKTYITKILKEVEND